MQVVEPPAEREPKKSGGHLRANVKQFSEVKRVVDNHRRITRPSGGALEAALHRRERRASAIHKPPGSWLRKAAGRKV